MRADITRVRDGRILAFLALFLLPSAPSGQAFPQHMERAKSTEFCLSCHTMEEYGKSLYVDDRSYLAAAHFQNNRIPRDRACYTCHTDYTMFGGLKDKWRGLSHVYVQYFGTIPGTGEIKLYQPFNNRECLHCHAGRPILSGNVRASEKSGPDRENDQQPDVLHVEPLSRHDARCDDTDRRLPSGRKGKNDDAS